VQSIFADFTLRHSRLRFPHIRESMRWLGPGRRGLRETIPVTGCPKKHSRRSESSSRMGLGPYKASQRAWLHVGASEELRRVCEYGVERRNCCNQFFFVLSCLSFTCIPSCSELLFYSITTKTAVSLTTHSRQPTQIGPLLQKYSPNHF
jgi:hypothetical protein